MFMAIDLIASLQRALSHSKNKVVSVNIQLAHCEPTYWLIIQSKTLTLIFFISVVDELLTDMSTQVAET